MAVMPEQGHDSIKREWYVNFGGKWLPIILSVKHIQTLKIGICNRICRNYQVVIVTSVSSRANRWGTCHFRLTSIQVPYSISPTQWFKFSTNTVLYDVPHNCTRQSHIIQTVKLLQLLNKYSSTDLIRSHYLWQRSCAFGPVNSFGCRISRNLLNRFHRLCMES